MDWSHLLLPFEGRLFRKVFIAARGMTDCPLKVMAVELIPPNASASVTPFQLSECIFQSNNFILSRRSSYGVNTPFLLLFALCFEFVLSISLQYKRYGFFLIYAPLSPSWRNSPSAGRLSVCISTSRRSVVRSRLWRRSLACACWSATVAACHTSTL